MKLIIAGSLIVLAGCRIEMTFDSRPSDEEPYHGYLVGECVGCPCCQPHFLDGTSRTNKDKAACLGSWFASSGNRCKCGDITMHSFTGDRWDTFTQR